MQGRQLSSFNECFRYDIHRCTAESNTAGLDDQRRLSHSRYDVLSDPVTESISSVINGWLFGGISTSGL